MKKIFSVIIISFIFFLAVPISTEAALVPCGTSGDDPCTLCHLIIGIHGLITYGRNILVVVAIGAIVVAGIIYIASAGNTKMMQQAKSFMLSVALGCIFFLGAWLIITVTLRILSANYTNLGVSTIQNWYTFSCDTTSSTKAPVNSSNSTFTNDGDASYGPR